MQQVKKLWLGAVVATVLAASVSPALAQTKSTTREGNSAKVTVRNPTPQELKALSEQMANVTSEDDRDLQIVTHKNGMKTVDLKGKFQSLTVAKRAQDGSVVSRCVDSHEEGKKFLKAKHKTAKRAKAAAAEKE